ncbi:MAG: DUF6390 family protein [Candidatus Limnocylindria bacterium]
MTAQLSAPTARSAPSGPVLFARYAYPPNRLGLCGPADAPALLDGAAAGADGELRELARGFEGAYPYLQLIAEQNHLADPLDERVVDAYWLGSPLTAAVRPRAMHRDLVERFRGRMPVGDWRWLEAALAGGSRPMHAFHVLEIFPRVGLMRGGRPDPVVETMDACRIRWGRVVDVVGEQLLVAARRLHLVDGRLELGPERTELANAWWGPAGPLDGVEPGDWVSLHWSWACDRLSPEQVARLASWTDLALASANRSV